MPIVHLPLDHLLSSTHSAESSTRRALSNVSLAVAKSKRVIVVSGAGISCSSGIPDFRSADGLYSLVKARYPDAFVTGRDLFSSGLFSNPTTTSLFYTFIAELSIACSAAKPTKTHHFLSKIESKGKLLRSYTQNVDGLERRIGLESGGRGKGLKKKGTRNVELHGDLGRVRCVLCMADFEARREWVEIFREGEAPECPACEERCESRILRAARALPVGTLRPAIVLYDEPHPHGDAIGDLQSYDLSRSPDLLLIMGTSLKVHGLKRLVKEFAKAVHAKKGSVIFVNATSPSREWEGVIDVHVHGETDRWVEMVEEEWRRFRPQDWETQTLLDGDVISTIAKGKAKAKGQLKCRGNPNLMLMDRSTGRIEQGEHPARARAIADCSLFPISPQIIPQLLPPLLPPLIARRPAGKSSKSVQRTTTANAAPHTPLSPSKRRANVGSVTPESGDSLTKKARSVLPPRTGLAGTPGRGNLFATTNTTAIIDECVKNEVFGSPKAKSSSSRPRKQTARGKENEADQPLARTKRLGSTTASEKTENGG